MHILYREQTPYRHQSCSWQPPQVGHILSFPWTVVLLEWGLNCCSSHSGNSYSTLQTYSLRTCLFLICCSISLAFMGFFRTSAVQMLASLLCGWFTGSSSCIPWPVWRPQYYDGSVHMGAPDNKHHIRDHPAIVMGLNCIWPLPCLCHVGMADAGCVSTKRGINTTLRALLWAFKEGLAFSNDYKHCKICIMYVCNIWTYVFTYSLDNNIVSRTRV